MATRSCSRIFEIGFARGDFKCNPGWSSDCVSLHTEIAPVLLEFVADLHLQPSTHGMVGPTWVGAQGFVGALDFFLSHRTTTDVGVVRMEQHAVFPSDDYPVCLPPLTLPALPTPGDTLTRVRYKMGTGVSQRQQQPFVDGCATLLSMPPTALLDTYHHFVKVLTSSTEVVFGPPGMPDIVPGLVSSAARVLHGLCAHTVSGGWMR